MQAKILVVDDPDILDALTMILDLLMPKMDGFAAAEQLKKDPQLSKIPVLMLTAFAAKRGETTIPVSRGFTLEAEDYIDKPVSHEELLSIVEGHLKKAGF